MECHQLDYVTKLGEILLVLLSSSSISQEELAIRTEISSKTIDSIINGTASITEEITQKFGDALGPSANFGNNLQKNYQDNFARLKE